MLVYMPYSSTARDMLVAMELCDCVMDGPKYLVLELELNLTAIPNQCGRKLWHQA
jgi:hypothetical protein